MRRSLYASTAIHAAILLWVAIGGSLFRANPDTEFEITGVTILSTAEFEALTTGQVPTPVVLDTPPAPQVTEEAAAPEAPAAETAPAEAAPPEPTPEPQVDTAPEPSPPAPQAEVTDTIAPPAPPSGDPDLPVTSTPTPREAPRIAPLPAPAPEPDVETAPEVIEQATAPATSETPVEAQPETAPEEATTEIVTEAEDPSGGPLGPVASVRPTARPNRPAPVEAVADTPAPAAPAADSIADAVAAAVADAVTTPSPAATPSGPPLSTAARDGFRIAVQGCWNVGSLSNEAQQTTVVVGFDMTRDGRPDSASLRLIEFTGGSDTAAQQAYEAARRAILRCGANGYDLPEESYDHWDQVELVFNPNGMRLR